MKALHGQPLNVYYEEKVRDEDFFPYCKTYSFSINFTEEDSNLKPIEQVEAKIREAAEIAIKRLKRAREDKLLKKITKLKTPLTE